MSKFNLMLGDCLERMKEIPDGSIDMILIDPPYVNMVKEKWDNLGKEYYDAFFQCLLEESYRVLRFGGRFISFSSNDTLKWLFNSKLQHRELLVIDKGVKQVSAGRNTKRYKQHVNATEYVFVCTKNAREYSRRLLLDAKGNLSAKEINVKLGLASNGGGMWSIYTGENKCAQVPTKEQWLKFKSIFQDLPDYCSFDEVFNNDLGKGNVLSGYNFRFQNRLHPTQKPISLLEYLIKTYTNENEVILDSTMGSGSTGVACANTNRSFIGIELDENYFNIAKERIENAYQQKEKYID